MMQFFFDVHDGRGRTFDDEGVELETLDEARKAAARELAQIMRDEMPDGARETYVVTVRDGNGVPVYIATATMLGEDLGRPA